MTSICWNHLSSTAGNQPLKGFVAVTPSFPVQWQNYEEFMHWLTERGVDLSGWGRGKAKTAEALWQEIREGETALFDHPVRRVVDTVVMIVRRGERVLVEAEQQLPDGRWRVRDWPPSEKLKRGEAYWEAAVRGIEEELQVPATQVQLHKESYRFLEVKKDSASYPTLPGVYRLHVVEAEITGLPDKRFMTEEVSLAREGRKKVHCWDWVVPEGELARFL